MQPTSKVGGGGGVYIFDPGHITKMAAIPIYGENLINLILQNYWAYCLETQYVASGELALLNLYK